MAKLYFNTRDELSFIETDMKAVVEAATVSGKCKTY